jgi:hypothetical protein
VLDSLLIYETSTGGVTTTFLNSSSSRSPYHFVQTQHSLAFANAMATFSVASLYQWPRHCTPKAREIVLSIIKSAKEPLSTKDIYNLAVERTGIEQATESPRDILKRLEKARDTDGTPPPHPSEEIRSLR